MRKFIPQFGNSEAIALLAGAIFVSLALQPGYAQTLAKSVAPLQEELDAYLERQAALQRVEADREGLIQELAFRWEPVAEDLGIGGDGWIDKFSFGLRQQSADTLVELSGAETWEELKAVFNGDAPQDLGDAETNLVLFPLTPCRIVDTRFATRWGGGSPPVGPNASIVVDTYGGDVGQGGAGVSTCGVDVSAKAVVINVAAVPVAGAGGNLRVYPWANPAPPPPNAGLLNYKLGTNISNATVQPICHMCSDDLFVYSSQTAHVVMDVIGFFAAPEATPLQIITLSAVDTLAANSGTSLNTNSCPGNYVLTGGGCKQGDVFSPDYNLIGSRDLGLQRWNCDFWNGTASPATITAQAKCARIPGR